jgi:phage terminase small subunit
MGLHPNMKPYEKAAYMRELFAQEFSISGNRTVASIKAGYKASSAKSQGSRLMKDPRVIARIAELKKVTADKFEVSREKVLAQYARIAFFDIRTIYDENNRLKDIAQLDEGAAAAINGIEVESILEGLGKITKVKIAERKAALDSICKFMGYNAPEKVDHTTKGEKMPAGGIDLSKLSESALMEVLKALTHEKNSG